MAYTTESEMVLFWGRAEIDSSLLSPSVIAEFIADATSMVEGALTSGGYTQCVPASVYADDASDCPRMIRLITRALVLRMAHTKNSIPLPDDTWDTWYSIRDIAEGRIEIPGVPRSVSRSVGGIHTTSASTSPGVFGRMRTP